MSGIKQTRWKRSRSFVRQFLQAYYVGAGVDGSYAVSTIQDTSGTILPSAGSGTFVDSLSMYVPSAGRDGGIAGFQSVITQYPKSDENGIVLGTGTNAVAPDDYSLQTKIADGTGAGQLEYFACGVTNLTINTGTDTASFDVERIFRNSSGGTITVNELAIYGSMTKDNFVGPDFRECLQICLVRDLESPGFAITNGSYARVVYTLSIAA